MEALHLIAAQRNVELCIKAFKEHCLTKKLAKESLLLNPQFNQLLESVLSTQNAKVFEIAIDFLIGCLKSKTVSPLALVALFQGKISKLKPDKIEIIPILSRLASVLSVLDQNTEFELMVQMATGESKIIPFLLHEMLYNNVPIINSSFFNFILGDPELVLNSFILDDSYYKLSRIRLLTFLVQDVGNEDYADALISYLVWNSGYFCSMEFDHIAPLSEYYSGRNSISQTHLDLLCAFIEYCCNAHMKFGSLELIIKNICGSCVKFLNYEMVLKLGCLALMRNFTKSDVSKSLLVLLQNFEELNPIGIVLCAKLLLTMDFDEEMIKMNQIAIEKCFRHRDHPRQQINFIEYLSQPFSEFGFLIRQAFQTFKISHEASHVDVFFDLIAISRDLPSLQHIDFAYYASKGHFEVLFNLLLFSWGNSDCAVIIDGLLSLATSNSNDDDERMFKYSYIVDFLETNLDGNMFLEFLPLFCSKVNRSDNILFSFVQQKLSSFLTQKADSKVQFPVMIGLRKLVECSQTRQSRLNFIAASVLSFLQNISNGFIAKVDCRSVYVAYDILTLLSEASVIDPRDIWSKIIYPSISNQIMWSNGIIRASTIRFIAAFKMLPEGPNAEINEIKMKAICCLLDQLDEETDPFTLNEICRTLCLIDLNLIRRVEVHRLNIGLELEEDSHPDDVLSRSMIFNPKLLQSLIGRFSVEDVYINKLLSKLVDYEVENMPRSLFLGSSSKAIRKLQTHITSYHDSPQFCNTLIYEIFSARNFGTVENTLLFFKNQFIPIIPSINNLHWYVRPHFPGILYNSVEKLISGIEDFSIKKQFAESKYLLESLKTSSTPQSLANAIMVTSSIMKALYDAQFISESYLSSNWVSVLCGDILREEKYKNLIGNEEVLSSVAISCNILSSCSNVIDASLSKLLNFLLLNNQKLKDGPSVYYAIEAFSKIDPLVLESLLLDNNCSNRKKFVSVVALLRIGYQDLSFINMDENDLNPISKHIGVLSSRYKRNFSAENLSLEEVSDFKGILPFSLSQLSPTELIEKHKDRAFSSANIPSTLKYDSILAYLFGSGLRIESFEYENHEEIANIEATTKDPKCLSLLYFVKRNYTKDSELKDDNSLNRFDYKQSWLVNISSMPGDRKFKVFRDCKLLPRIDWGSVPFTSFAFVMKHTLSVTPVTNNIYINPSLLRVFFGYADVFIDKSILNESNLRLMLDIIVNTPDERTQEVISKLLERVIEINADNLLTIAFEHLRGTNRSILKSFDFLLFNRLNPELLLKFSKFIIDMTQYCSFETDLLYIFDDSKALDVFTILKSVIEKNDFELRLAYVIEYMISFSGRDVKINMLVVLMDLMFVKQNNLTEFSRLTLLIQSYCDRLLIEGEYINFDSHIADKLRLRMNLLPESLKSRIELFLVAHENDKRPF